MSVESRAIARAWAEAELATREARQAQGADGPSIPSAEDFRSVPRTSRREVRRTRITRWLRPGTGDEPLPEELERRVIREGNTAWLQPTSRGDSPKELKARGVFDRITYVQATPPTYMPPLIESLSVPPLVGGQVPGWEPMGASDPHTVLARPADLERAPAPKEPKQETVDVFLHLAEPE